MSNPVIGRFRPDSAELQEKALQEKVQRRRLLIADLVQLESELLAAGVLRRRVVWSRSLVHGPGRQAGTETLDGRGGMD